MFLEVVENLGAEIVAACLELFAELVTADDLATLLVLGEKQRELHAAEAEAVATPPELHDT